MFRFLHNESLPAEHRQHGRNRITGAGSTQPCRKLGPHDRHHRHGITFGGTAVPIAREGNLTKQILILCFALGVLATCDFVGGPQEKLQERFPIFNASVNQPNSPAATDAVPPVAGPSDLNYAKTVPNRISRLNFSVSITCL